MNIFIFLTLVTMVAVFSVDVRQKRQKYIQQQSTQQNDF